MAEIKLCAMANALGPSIPGDLAAFTRDEPWPGGGFQKVLCLAIGDSTITIWPADPEKIENLGRKLLAIAERLK